MTISSPQQALTLILLFFAFKSWAVCPNIPSEQLQQEHKSVIEVIHYHNDLYETGKAIIQDDEYDALTHRQKELERCLGNPPSQSQHIPPPQSLHKFPMGSLKKARDRNDVIKFIEKAESLGSPVILQPKIDGIAVELFYQKGKLTRALTRGSRTINSGINLLHLIPSIPAIPTIIPGNQEETIIHGELYTQPSNENIQQASSPRHYVAGLINQKEPQKIELQTLQFFPWLLVDSPFLSARESATQLKRWGFSDTLSDTHVVDNISDITALRLSYESPTKAHSIPLDGIVIKFDSTSVQKHLGHRNGTPHWALAWKFSPQFSVSQVSGIRWTVGRTGQITILVDINPVTIKGIDIKSVNAGPLEYFRKQDIAISDSISIALKGAATPVLHEVLVRPLNRRLVELPGSTLYTSLTCLKPSAHCKEQFVARVKWLTGRNGLNVPGFHSSQIRELIVTKRIKSLQDVFKLEMSDVGADIYQILQTPNLSLAQQIRALGIPKVGRKKSEWLAHKAKNMPNILTANNEQIREWLRMSQAEAQVVISYLHLPEIIALIEHMEPYTSDSSANP